MVEDNNSRLSDNESEESIDINERIKGLDQMNFDDPADYVDTVSDRGKAIFFKKYFIKCSEFLKIVSIKNIVWLIF